MTQIKESSVEIGQIVAVKTLSTTPDALVEVKSSKASPAMGSEFQSARLQREFKTVSAMVRIYCRGHKHSACDSLCPECRSLLDYAFVRLQRCVFGAEKPTCVKCPVHCYQKMRREEMKSVMRYAGPRMLWRHPVLSVRHWLDSRAEAPEKR